MLRQAAAGESMGEIAVSLCLETGTVKNLFVTIYRYLDVRNRTQAVAEAMRRGLIS